MRSNFKAPKEWTSIELDESSAEDEAEAVENVQQVQDQTSETPNEATPTPSTTDDTPSLIPASSSSSSCCRICQDNSDTSEPLETSQCSCKGQLAIVHRRCLIEWVRYKGSNKCEICGGTFRGVPNPPRDTLGLNDLETLNTLRLQLAHFRPISRRKRSGLAALLTFLVIITVVMGVLSFGADKEFKRVTEDPWSSDHEIRKTHIVFSICLSFLFFCITLTVGISIMWGVLELFFYLHQRRVVRSAARRMVHEMRRTRQAGPSEPNAL